MKPFVHRREFLRMCAGLAGTSALARYQTAAAAERGRVKIRDNKVMMLQGPRTYTLIKVESDAARHSR